MLGDYFDHCYLINLEHREDRKELSLKECEKVGLKPEVFSAVDGSKERIRFRNLLNIPHIQWNNYAAALNLTTIRLLEDAKKNNYRSVLILEDDIEFHPDINEVFDRNFSLIPPDWEMIQLGCMNRLPPQQVAGNIFRIRKGDCLHCYAIRDCIYNKMISETSKMLLPLDWVTQLHIQPEGKCYCVVPNLAFQRPGFSNISNMEVNFSFLR